MPDDKTSKNAIFNLDTDVLNNAFSESMGRLGLGALTTGFAAVTAGAAAAGGSMRNYTVAAERLASVIPRGEVVVPPEQMQRFMAIDPARGPDETAISFMGMPVTISEHVERPTIVNRSMTSEQIQRLNETIDAAISRTIRQNDERLLRSAVVTNQLPSEQDSVLTVEMLTETVNRLTNRDRTETSVSALQVPAKPLPSDNGGKRRINVRRRK